MPGDWYVYIARCRDGLYYTGITNDLAKRLRDHNAGKGAIFTAGRRPIQLVYSEKHLDKSSARKREIQIKDWRREKKERLIACSEE